jgi:hypothetical protein
MKKAYWFVALSSFAFAFVCAAQQPDGDRGDAATTPQSQDNPQMRMQMQQMQQMESRMQAMRALMERIQNTEDPEERQRLMDEHAKSMQQGMMMMGDMMRGQPQGGQCAANDTACGMQRMQGQQDLMRQHMGMMQMMMQQMMGQMMQRETQPEAGEKPDQQNHEEHH